MDSRHVERYARLTIPFVAVLSPFLFLWTLYLALRGAVLDGFMAPLPGFFPFLLLAVGTLDVLVSLRQQRFSGTGAKLREIAIVIIGAYLLLLLTRGDLVQGDFDPTKPDVIAGLALVVLQWLISLGLFRALAHRTHFLRLCADAPPETRAKHVQELNSEHSSADDGLDTVRRVLLWLGAVLLVVVIAAHGIASGVVIRGTETLLILYTAHLLLALFILNRAKTEHALLSDGLEMPEEALRHQTWLFIGITALVALAVLPIVGKESAFPARYLAEFVQTLDERLFGSETMTLRPSETTGRIARREREDFEIQRDYADPTVDTSTPLTQRIARIVGIAVLGLIGVGVLYFLVRPLFSERDGEFNLAAGIARLRSRFQTIMASIPKAIRDLVAWLRRPKRGLRSAAKGLLQRIQESPLPVARKRKSWEAGRSRSDRKALGKAVRAFVRVVRWGERQGVPYSVATPPLEYVQRLNHRTENPNPQLTEAAELFEEIVFSPTAPEDSKIAALIEKVTQALRG